jgi:hypothetical protein
MLKIIASELKRKKRNKLSGCEVGGAETAPAGTPTALLISTLFSFICLTYVQYFRVGIPFPDPPRVAVATLG